MKRTLLCGLVVMAAATLRAADVTPLTEVKDAAATLGDQKNYSWLATVDPGPNSNFRPGPTEGKTEKGGVTYLTMSFGDNDSEVVIQGTNAALKTPDSGWMSLSEATKDSGGGGFNPTMMLVRTVQNFKTPAVQAVDLAQQVKELKKDTNGIGGDLTEDGAKGLLRFGRRGGNGGEAPTISNAKGSTRFWIADGKLTKYQFHVQGTVSFNGNDRDIDRTTTVEIKAVNSTRIDVPGEAKKKLP